MPTYVYVCGRCGHSVEVIAPIAARDECPTCIVCEGHTSRMFPLPFAVGRVGDGANPSMPDRISRAAGAPGTLKDVVIQDCEGGMYIDGVDHDLQNVTIINSSPAIEAKNATIRASNLHIS